SCPNARNGWAGRVSSRRRSYSSFLVSTAAWRQRLSAACSSRHWAIAAERGRARSSWLLVSRYSAWRCSHICFSFRSRSFAECRYDQHGAYGPLVWFWRCARAAQPDVLLSRRFDWEHGRRPPGDGTVGDDLDAFAAHLRHETGGGDPDDRRRVLWGPVWRRHPLHP